jgi:hypothetical protein
VRLYLALGQVTDLVALGTQHLTTLAAMHGSKRVHVVVVVAQWQLSLGHSKVCVEASDRVWRQHSQPSKAKPGRHLADTLLCAHMRVFQLSKDAHIFFNTPLHMPCARKCEYVCECMQCV